MSSLHSTLTALVETLVREILRTVRENSLQELVGAAPSADRKRAPASTPPARQPPRRAARAKEATKRRAPKESAAPTRRASSAKGKRAALRAPRAVEDAPTGYGDAQITDPDALLRETAVTLPAPRPTAAELPVVAETIKPMLTTPTLREGEDILRTASGRAVLRRRREA